MQPSVCASARRLRPRFVPCILLAVALNEVSNGRVGETGSSAAETQRTKTGGLSPTALALITCIIVITSSLGLVGCGGSEKDNMNGQAQVTFDSAPWKKAAAEDISVRIISVLQRPSPSLTWREDRPGLNLSQLEKQIIESQSVTGELEVIKSDGRGSGSMEVRVVIIQHSPVTKSVNLPVPARGSFIYIQKEESLAPLFTDGLPSALVLQVSPQPGYTAFRLDYPRDRTTYGGALFWWDKDGNFQSP